MYLQQDRENLIARLSSMRTVSCNSIALDEEEQEILDRQLSSEFKILELEKCLHALEEDKQAWREEQNKLKVNSLRLETELENAINENKHKELIICEQERIFADKYKLETSKSNLLITISCQTDTLNDDESEHLIHNTTSTRSIASQTAQHLLVKSYPSLTHSCTQTPNSNANSAATPNNKTLKQDNNSSHEIKSLQARISTLNKQLKVLTTAKDQLKRDYDIERTMKAALTRQVDELQLKLKINKGEVDLLSKESLMLRQSNMALEEHLQIDKEQKQDETASQVMQLQSRLKSYTDECTKQANTTNKLKKELNDKKSGYEQLSDTSVRKEREFRKNLKQKRHLIDDMREEINKFKQRNFEYNDIITKQSCELQRLSKCNDNLNAKNLTYKTRIAEIVGENGLRIDQVNELNRNLSSVADKLNETSDECTRKNNMLKIAHSQINYLSYIFENDSSDEELNSSTPVHRSSNVTQLYYKIQTNLSNLAEKIWKIINKSNRNSLSKDILTISYNDTLQLATNNTIRANSANQIELWENTNYNKKITSALRCTPPQFNTVIEIILDIIGDRT